MKRIAWGTLAMSLSFLLGSIISAGSFLAMGGRLESEQLTATPFSLPTLLVSCLDPLVIMLEIAAMIVIVRESRRMGGAQKRMAWMAAIFFVLWGVLNLGVFIPLSITGMRRGSLELVKTGQMVKAIAALLQYAVPFLLVFCLSRKTPRVLLIVALILTIVGNFSVVVNTINAMELKVSTAGGETLRTPQFSVDYTSGIYPYLLATGYTGGGLYMIAYGILTARFFKKSRAEAPAED